MNELTLLDLECILVDNKERGFNIELNEEELDVTTDWLWKKIHSSEIKVADLVEENFVYIKLKNKENKEEQLLIFI